MKSFRKDNVIITDQALLDNYLCDICKEIPFNSVSCSKCNSKYCEECVENNSLNNKNKYYCKACQDYTLFTKEITKFKEFFKNLKLTCPEYNCKTKNLNYNNLLIHLNEYHSISNISNINEIKRSSDILKQPSYIDESSINTSNNQNSGLIKNVTYTNREKHNNDSLCKKNTQANNSNSLLTSSKIECLDCGVILKTEDLNIHKQSCKEIQIKCSQCLITIKRKFLLAHVKEECLETEIICSKCRILAKRRIIEHHNCSNSKLDVIYTKIMNYELMFNTINENINMLNELNFSRFQVLLNEIEKINKSMVAKKKFNRNKDNNDYYEHISNASNTDNFYNKSVFGEKDKDRIISNSCGEFFKNIKEDSNIDNITFKNMNNKNDNLFIHFDAQTDNQNELHTSKINNLDCEMTFYDRNNYHKNTIKSKFTNKTINKNSVKEIDGNEQDKAKRNNNEREDIIIINDSQNNQNNLDSTKHNNCNQYNTIDQKTNKSKVYSGNQNILNLINIDITKNENINKPRPIIKKNDTYSRANQTIQTNSIAITRNSSNNIAYFKKASIFGKINDDLDFDNEINEIKNNIETKIRKYFFKNNSSSFYNDINYPITITCSKQLPKTNFSIDILVERISAIIALGFSNKNIDENKVFLGIDFNKGNWSILSSGFPGEEGNLGMSKICSQFEEGDIITLTCEYCLDDNINIDSKKLHNYQNYKTKNKFFISVNGKKLKYEYCFFNDNRELYFCVSMETINNGIKIIGVY